MVQPKSGPGMECYGQHWYNQVCQICALVHTCTYMHTTSWGYLCHTNIHLSPCNQVPSPTWTMCSKSTGEDISGQTFSEIQYNVYKWKKKEEEIGRRRGKTGERERETDRQTDRQTEREREREREREGGRIEVEEEMDETLASAHYNLLHWIIVGSLYIVQVLSRA